MSVRENINLPAVRDLVKDYARFISIAPGDKVIVYTLYEGPVGTRDLKTVYLPFVALGIEWGLNACRKDPSMPVQPSRRPA
jgi:hypothetical protein